MTRIAIHGAGRMGCSLLEASAERSDVKIEAVVAPHDPEFETDVPCFRQLDALPEPPDVLIDFTLPSGTVNAANWCGRTGVALVSGVTGLDVADQQTLERAARSAAVLWAPNLSIGVNLLADLVQRAAAVLDASVPARIVDIHHQWKKDAPSGTALMLGKRAAGAEGRRSVEYDSERRGEVVGDHHVEFRLPGETLILSHSALERIIFARGALAAAVWLAAQPHGRYSAADWLQGRSHGAS